MPLRLISWRKIYDKYVKVRKKVQIEIRTNLLTACNYTDASARV